MITTRVLALSVLLCCYCDGLTPSEVMNRRQAFRSAAGSAAILGTSIAQPALVVQADDAVDDDPYKYESRNRNSNKKAVIREDYWYMSGKTPPRKLENSLGRSFDNPKWNTWGTCETSESGGNSCTYVSLKQKIPAYSKYAFNIKLGTEEFGELGKVLKSNSKAWENEKAIALLSDLPSGLPCPAEDSLLKAVLLATALLTSPNYSGPPRELLVARFYVNEASFALNEIRDALEAQDWNRAVAAWEFGRDSWNSYFMVVNRAIVPKVGDQFPIIS